ncbi:MAG: hypothetical protein AB8I08_15635 [Sandaracinaceae bacterium]
MHQRFIIRLLTCLAVVASLGLVACGGDDSERRRTTVDWQASDRLPQTASHWWWQPVERYCEESTDCRQGETCQMMRLGTCGACPRGEEAMICIPREDARQASQQSR